MTIVTSAIPSNLYNYGPTCNFNNLRVAQNDYLNNSRIISKKFTSLLNELEFVIDNFVTLDDDTDWTTFTELKQGDSINVKWFKTNSFKVLNNQIMIKEQIETDAVITLTLPWAESDSMEVLFGDDEFVDADIINRLLYRLWENSRQILKWLENFKNYSTV